jgi:hypothetical protein
MDGSAQVAEERKQEEARKRARAYYYANKEHCLERGRAWRTANKEKVKANNAAYHAANRERENARSQAYKDENRETINAQRRAAYAANMKQERAYARDKKKAGYSRTPLKYRELARLARAMPRGKEKQAAWGKAWAERNRQRTKAASRRWYQRNLDHARLQLAISQASRRRRNVPWANKEAIAAFYTTAAILTRTTGRKHVVDHIIPLRGRKVSGLHVETNLRVIEQFENARKFNKWESPGFERTSTSPGDVPLASADAPPSQLTLF